ncbi:MAG: alpha/beta fold hydrolase [Alphaproteobacteria bacterium]|nr:alpha/beta fold hydrolase [Alphaproteobacteria bacterium]
MEMVPSTDPPLPPVVVCLHGFLRTGASMLPMAYALRRGGYKQFIAPTYLYQLRRIGQIADELARRLAVIADREGSPVDLVTHSYGGLLARAVMPHAPVRRVVMLAPPNQGAQVAELARQVIPVHRLGWDPLAEVLPGAPAALPAGPAEIGIITGGRPDTDGYNPLLDGDNDFTIRVDEARLPNARAFRVVEAHHTVIMANPTVQRLTLAFLRTGAFPEEGSSGVE